MPVKNYVSRNGQVEYEYDDLGDILTYGRDALGNVVAGYDAATNAVFTADYKPYGEFAATTGNVAGRRFMWVGSWGYRFTSGVPVSHYVRARHLSMRMGMWTSVDPLWPTEDAFGYVGGMPTAFIDPLGLQGNQPPRRIGPPKTMRQVPPRYQPAFRQPPNPYRGPMIRVITPCGPLLLPQGLFPLGNDKNRYHYYYRALQSLTNTARCVRDNRDVLGALAIHPVMSRWNDKLKHCVIGCMGAGGPNGKGGTRPGSKCCTHVLAIWMEIRPIGAGTPDPYDVIATAVGGYCNDVIRRECPPIVSLESCRSCCQDLADQWPRSAKDPLKSSLFNP